MTPEYRIETENRIKDYLESQNVFGIKYMQVEQTFNDLGVEINVWNVKTENSNWWVVEGEDSPMNLYTQDANYFSADEAYSFHMGITQRLSSSYAKDFKHIIDEIPLDIENLKSISRRLNKLGQDINNITGPEDVQNIGLSCRESLIELANIHTKGIPNLLQGKDIKASDFKGIAKEAISVYASGSSNKSLRKHARELSDMAWDYASELVHSKNRNYPDAKICLLFTCSIVSVFQNLHLKFLGFDSEPKCPVCNSMDYIMYATDNDDVDILKCNNCNQETIIKNGTQTTELS